MLKFSIIDFTASELYPTITVIDEPVGWDSVDMRLKRDKLWHGFFDFFDDVLNQMQFYGNAVPVLKDAYDTYGVEAHLELLIEYACGDNDGYETLYQGKFNFTRYAYICADWCRVECGVENNNCLMTFRNRYDQKVDLESLQSMDATADDLPEYKWLGREINLPSKIVTFTTEYSNPIDREITLDLFAGQAGPPFTRPCLMAPDYEFTIQEIVESSTGSGLPFYHGIGPSFEPDKAIDFDAAGLKCAGDLTIKIDVTASFVDNCGGGWSPTFLRFVIIRDTSWGTYSPTETTGPNKWEWDLDPFNFVQLLDTITIPSFTNGDKIWMFFAMSVSNFTNDCSPDLKILEGSKITYTLPTLCADTHSKVYMVNEALSRVTESITGDCMRVKSDYFGRVDSEPYVSDEAGCGALEVITNGLIVRTKEQKYIKIGDTEFYPKMTVSMKDLFDSLTAIHNVGMGLELDTERNDGSEWVRIEPIDYFYKNDILMECPAVSEIRAAVDAEKIFSKANIGYDKWETESVNGLNDVFGRREYRTSLKVQRNTYEKLCKFIGSDYAIEITRRQYGTSTKDWRYDNDTFIICMRNGIKGLVFQNGDNVTITGDFTDTIQIGDTITITGSVSNNGTYTVSAVNLVAGGLSTEIVTTGTFTTEIAPDAYLVCNEHPFYSVEQGGIDAGTTANIMAPEYCYNLRITPARNAMRHIPNLFRSYGPVWASGRLLFTAGDGNYIAIINVEPDACLLEADSGLLENGNIDGDTFADTTSMSPVYTADLVKFEYPVTYEQYKAIRANPYGRIGYGCTADEISYGYIEDFRYKPYTGMGEFTLRPKI